MDLDGDFSKPRFEVRDFAAPTKECDLVMKGGVTSGVVYPYAILELARVYRFRSIGGTSAGAIAASFAAAAEHARANGDPAGFCRLEERCLTLPDILEGLFQPSRPFIPVLAALKGWAFTGSPRRWVRALSPFGATLAAGALAGAGTMAAFSAATSGGRFRSAALPGMALGAMIGATAALAGRLGQLGGKQLPDYGFGFCSGMGDPDGPPVLTQWIHDSLQYIAFGTAKQSGVKPLTFGDLRMASASAGESGRGIALRMMTTNLSMGRPHALPILGGDFGFSPDSWKRLFPNDVMAYLDGISALPKPDPRFPAAGLRGTPEPDDWPVICAIRMSLSFPLLLETVPLWTHDLGEVVGTKVVPGCPAAKPRLKEVLFSDGGLSSNFPIHFFDSFLPERPTFALSLDACELGTPRGERVHLPQSAAEGSFSPIRAISSTGDFAGSILDAAKDWQDAMLAAMPGQRERVVRVKLEPSEGGLNLTMGRDVSERLMQYGLDAGIEIIKEFDFDEHRWRRTLTAYEQLDRTVVAAASAWPSYNGWFSAYNPPDRSYKNVTAKNSAAMSARIEAFAQLSKTFVPDIVGKGKFPRPAGRLRIVPNV